MSEASQKSSPTTSLDTRNATSSPVSADGATPCASPDGPTTDLFGQALAPVNRSAPPASSVAATMSATYGLRSTASSASAALQLSLGSRLQERLDSRGSTMFALTWKAKVTPLRRQICQLAASAHRTGDSGCGGWPTTRACDGIVRHSQNWMAKRIAENRDVDLTTAVSQLAAWPTPRSEESFQGEEAARAYAEAGFTQPKVRNGKERASSTYDTTLATAAYAVVHYGMKAQLAAWPTPTKGNADGSQQAKDASATGRRPDGSKATVSLNGVAQLAAWPTPNNVPGGSSGESLEKWQERADKKKAGGVNLHRPLHIEAQLAAWPTPVKQDAASSGSAAYSTDSGRHSGTTLTDAARMASWPTPMAGTWATPASRDWRSNEATDEYHAKRLQEARGKPLSEQTHQLLGATSPGSPAPTEKRGQLNPSFSRWLMGYPKAWDDCAPIKSKPSKRSA